MENNQQHKPKSNLKLHITPEDELIVKDFFKDEFTYYTSIAYKSPQDFIVVQNATGFVIFKDGILKRKYKNEDSKEFLN